MGAQPRWPPLALFVLALLPRVYVAIAWTREPVWDGHYYDIGARSIAAGLGYAGTSGGPWCHYPVGYSALLGVGYALSGGHPLTGPLLNALMGALTAALVYLLAARFTTPRRAWIAGGLCALYPGLIAYTPILMTEPTAALSLVVAALAAARGGHRPGGVVGSGVLLGLATLVRPQSILLAPFVGLLAPGRAAIVRSGLLATAIAVATVSPWTVRNCLVMDGCAFVSTNGGWNLAIGSFPRATGRFATLRASDGCRVVTGQVQQDRCWLAAGAGFIAADPLRWLGLVDDKLGFTFDHESFPVGYLAEADPAAWPEPRRALGRGVLSWSFRLLLVASALALAPRPSRRRPMSLVALLGVALLAFYGATTPGHPHWPLALAIPALGLWRWRALIASPRGRAALFCAAAVAGVALTHAVFFGEDRYHMVLVPLCCLLAACAGER